MGVYANRQKSFVKKTKKKTWISKMLAKLEIFLQRQRCQ